MIGPVLPVFVFFCKFHRADKTRRDDKMDRSVTNGISFGPRRVPYRVSTGVGPYPRIFFFFCCGGAVGRRPRNAFVNTPAKISGETVLGWGKGWGW